MWASFPLPAPSFLEQYDFAGKTGVPFCSHGGVRLGQSLTAIAEFVPNATIAEGLAIHYSGGTSMPSDVSTCLGTNGFDEINH